MASLLLCLSSWRMRFLLTWRFWSPLWWALSSQRKEFRSDNYLTVFVYHLVSIYTGIFILILNYNGFCEHLLNFFTKLDTLQRRWGPSCHLQWRRPMWWGGHFSRRWRWWWGWWRPENPRVRKGWFFVLFAQWNWVFFRMKYILYAHCVFWMYSSKPSQWVVTVNFYLLFRLSFCLLHVPEVV